MYVFVAQGSNRVESLLIGAIPENIGALICHKSCGSLERTGNLICRPESGHGERNLIAYHCVNSVQEKWSPKDL
tara:strand:- start:273 stop:494 length:222 start_codon:yes stop_codon:yes gene_type:complete